MTAASAAPARAAPRAAPAQRQPLRLLTINMHKGFGFLNRGFVLHELRDAVRATGADVVFLQEVLGAHRRHAQRHPTWPAQPQYEFLADSMWPQYAYGRNAVYPDGDHGNALLSKFPIARHDNIDVSMGPHERRGLLHCELALPGTDTVVHAICVHLGLRESQRRAQVERLVDYVAQAIPDDAPLIVAGDFNDWRERIGAALDAVGLRDVFVERDGVGARTFPGRWPLLRLDRIYVRGVTLEDAAVLDTHPWPHLSDHVPLYAQVSA
ncbi:endonuclease/exonuclease/phosphatase family protein [Chiayiivirga flava]|uniref:Endonuclease/exonuclease/phosphatase family metal-dependent hydrolase n=1 Tax=Chiayiivirga flava TaxID=659595 RepID=A0A7W8G0R8_9GAMM|nr:endonuclease/exonuclease/phosphatase family metal-dependent hydrolase [Chiayiivirga flava]